MFDTEVLEELREYAQSLNVLRERTDSERWTTSTSGLDRMIEAITKQAIPIVGTLGVLTGWDADSRKKLEDVFASVYVTLVLMYDDAPGMDLKESVDKVASATLEKLRNRLPIS